MPGVLIVDADAAVREVLTTVFTRHGFSVRAVGQSDEAVRLARSEAPDVVVTALDLHPIDGVELIGQLRALPGNADLPVVIFTATTPHDTLARLGEAPPAHLAVETKGGSTRPVLAAVRRLLAERGGGEVS